MLSHSHVFNVTEQIRSALCEQTQAQALIALTEGNSSHMHAVCDDVSQEPTYLWEHFREMFSRPVK